MIYSIPYDLYFQEELKKKKVEKYQHVFKFAARNTSNKKEEAILCA